MAKNVEKNLRSWNNQAAAVMAAFDPEVLSESRDMTFGEFLKRERVLRDITKEEVLRVTKVSPEYYEALETDRLEQLPPKAFVVGFLRVLSKYAGLDSDELVNRFLAQFARIGKEVSPIEEPTPSFFRKNYRKILLACGFACLAILMFAPLLRGM